MAKVTGFKCDICDAVENGHDRPTNWMALKLPSYDHTELDTFKDICSDKCLLRFAKDRNGVAPRTGTRPNKDEANPLNSFLTKHGVKSTSRPGIIGGHTKGRHEATGGRENCLVCQFLNGETVASA